METLGTLCHCQQQLSLVTTILILAQLLELKTQITQVGLLLDQRYGPVTEKYMLNLLAEIRERFPRVFIGAGYGMTEMCGAISQANGEAFLANSKASGQVLPMVDVQITDEVGNACALGETGEIWAKGANLMQGYYGRPAETAAAMSGD